MRFASAAAVTSLAISLSSALPLQTSSVYDVATSVTTDVPAPTFTPPQVGRKCRRDEYDPNGHIYDQNFQSAVLYHHNIHRANHSAPDVQWDAGLAATALKIAQTCVYQHDTSMDGGGYGQNIGYGYHASEIGKLLTDSMYNSELMYFWNLFGQSQTDNKFEDWGHFTQMVWKSTTSVGCATFLCQSLANGASGPEPYTVCNYKPGGNFGGEYLTNVLPPLGNAFFSI